MRYAFLPPGDARWADTLHKLAHDFYYIPEYLTLNAKFEEGEAFAFVAEKGDNIFFLPLIVRPVSFSCCDFPDDVFYDAISPYGYSSPLVRGEGGADGFYRESLEIFFRELKKRNVVTMFARLHPLLACPEKLKDYGTLIYHGRTVSINLNSPEREIWQQIRGNHRNGIKRAEDMGQKIFVDRDWDYWDEFIKIYYETMNRNGADPYYYFNPEYFIQMRQTMRRFMHLVIVLCQEEVAAASLFTEVDGIVQYHFSGTADRYLTSGCTKALLYFMILWEKQRGNRILHIGGGLGGKEDSLYHYKAGFSKSRHLFYTWRVITNEEIYSRLIDEWEKCNARQADQIDGFFPAYRKSLLPLVLVTVSAVTEWLRSGPSYIAGFLG